MVARAEDTGGCARAGDRRGVPAAIRRLVSRVRRVAAAYVVVTALGSLAIGSTAGVSSTVQDGLGPKASWPGPAGAAPSWWQPPALLAPVPPAAAARGPIQLSEVGFEGRGTWPEGPEAIRGYLEEALDRIGITEPPARGRWIDGMMTIADHEAQFHSGAINLSDSNAYGPPQPDGGPLHATRGPWQVMPDTFAMFHQAGTSNSAWDPVATACASMNYQMSRYGVNRDGSNQRMLVGQANPGIRQGY